MTHTTQATWTDIAALLPDHATIDTHRGQTTATWHHNLVGEQRTEPCTFPQNTTITPAGGV